MVDSFNVSAKFDEGSVTFKFHDEDEKYLASLCSDEKAWLYEAFILALESLPKDN